MKNKVITIVVLVILIILLIALAVVAYVSTQKVDMDADKLNNEVSTLENNTNTNTEENGTMDLVATENNNVTNNESSRVKMTVNNNEVYITLNNSQASRDFIAMLPLTVECEDYNNTEKIATLPNELSTEGSPSGYTPEIGDFAYYAPWGNLSMFYKEFRYSNSLIKLGTFESGIEEIGSLNSDFTATFELANN